MRWDQLFADLEGQLSAARAQEGRAELGELVRAERATVLLADRLRATCGRVVRLHVGDGPGERDAVVAGELVRTGPDWVLVREPDGRQALVPLSAVEVAEGLVGHISPASGRVEAHLGLGTVLRALGRDRVEVQVHTSGCTVVGRVERVGADHVDLGTERGALPRTVPLRVVRVVRSR